MHQRFVYRLQWHRILCILPLFAYLIFKIWSLQFQQWIRPNSDQFITEFLKENETLDKNGDSSVSDTYSDFFNGRHSVIDDGEVIISKSHANVSVQKGVFNSDTEVGLRLAKRRANLWLACHKKHFTCNIQHVFRVHEQLFHHYNATVCTIAKAGSSTWRAHLRSVNHGPPPNRPIDEDVLREAFFSRKTDEIIKDINASAKILTVRHPLARLVSAYINKYHGGKSMLPHDPVKEAELRQRIAGDYWDERFYQFWLPALAANDLIPSDAHLKVGLRDPINPKTRYDMGVYERLYSILKPSITFQQYLRFVVKTYRDGTPDRHWEQFYYSCCPCYFDYDFMTKVETLSEDLDFVFRKLGIPSDPKLTKNKSTRSVVDELYRYFAYYKSIPNNLKREVYEYIKDDMELFGYELPRGFLSN